MSFHTTPASSLRSVLKFGPAVAVLLTLFGETLLYSQPDPHRPPCNSSRCKKIELFLKQRYCGQSPFGNGPDEGCDIARPADPGTGVSVIADWECPWSDVDGQSPCEQHGEPTAAIRAIVTQHMRRLGLVTRPNGHTYFRVWKPASANWWLAEGDYFRLNGSRLDVCQVILIVDQKSLPVVIRKVRFQQTDADVPDVTQWSAFSIADVDGDGQLDIVLRGDAYESHWMEVVTLQGRSAQTIFSGLGYYL